MIYNHTVKVNGEYYPAGVETPEEIDMINDLVSSDVSVEAETQPAKRGRTKKNS